LIPICRKHSLQVLGRRGRGADLCLKRFCSYSLKMSKLSKAEAASREAALALRVVKKRLLRYLPDDEDGDLSHRGGNKKTSESRIVKLVVDMDSELDMLVKAVAVLLPLLDQEDQVLHKQHLEDWAEYCEILRQQAEEVISKMKRDDQEERTIATGDDGVGDDYEAEDPDGSHEGRGARTEQAFSHTAEDAVATVVHTDHLLTADHATLEGSSEMVAVEIQDLRELAPVLVPPEDYQGLATHIGEEHNLEVEKEEVPDAASYTGQLKSQGSLQATCDDGEPVHGVTDDPKLPVLCHHGGGEVVTAIVHDLEKLFEVEEMDVAVNKACKDRASHLGKPEFDMRVSAEMVEDLSEELLITMGCVEVRGVLPGLAALDSAGLPGGLQVHGHQGGGDVQVEPGGSCLLNEPELLGSIAKYIEPAVASSDILELHNVGLCDNIGGEAVIAKMLEVENCITAVPGVQLYAEGLKADVGGIKSAYCYQEAKEILEEKEESTITTAKLVVVGLMKEAAETVVCNMVELCRGVVELMPSILLVMLTIALTWGCSACCGKQLSGVDYGESDHLGGVAEQCVARRYQVPSEVGSLYKVDYMQSEYYNNDYDCLDTESDKTQYIQD